MSNAINNLLLLARTEGLEPSEAHTGQWSKTYAYGFVETMPASIRAAGLRDSSLRHISYEGDPHNRSHEGFMDDDAETSIDFAL